jgi:hypothetical protein
MFNARLAALHLTYHLLSLSSQRFDVAATSVAGRAIFAGGIGPGLNSVDRIDVYDTQTQAWSTASLSIARAGMAAATVAGKAIFAGGDTGNGSNFADIYDAASGLWSAACLPIGLSFGATAAVVGDKVFFVASSTGSDGFDEYDAATDQWSAVQAPPHFTSGAIVAVGEKAYLVPSVAGQPTTVYDAMTDQWSTLDRGPDSPSCATAVGSRLIVLDYGKVSIYDSVTGRTRVESFPGLLRGDGGGTTIGQKAIFPSINVGTAGMFNAATGELSTLPARAGGSAVTTIGSQAFVAGDGDGPTASVDVYTDTAPVAALAGGIAGRSGGKATVVLSNTGDADLPDGYTVNVYAIPPGQYHGAILLGSSAALTGPLAAGSSIRLSVLIQLPANAAAGTYHLVAMVRASDGTLTPFAGGTATFRVRPATVAQAAPAAAARSPFATGPLVAPSSAGDPLGLHDHRSAWAG